MASDGLPTYYTIESHWVRYTLEWVWFHSHRSLFNHFYGVKNTLEMIPGSSIRIPSHTQGGLDVIPELRSFTQSWMWNILFRFGGDSNPDPLIPNWTRFHCASMGVSHTLDGACHTHCGVGPTLRNRRGVKVFSSRGVQQLGRLVARGSLAAALP